MGRFGWLVAVAMLAACTGNNPAFEDEDSGSTRGRDTEGGTGRPTMSGTSVTSAGATSGTSQGASATSVGPGSDDDTVSDATTDDDSGSTTDFDTTGDQTQGPWLRLYMTNPVIGHFAFMQNSPLEAASDICYGHYQSTGGDFCAVDSDHLPLLRIGEVLSGDNYPFEWWDSPVYGPVALVKQRFESLVEDHEAVANSLQSAGVTNAGFVRFWSGGYTPMNGCNGWVDQDANGVIGATDQTIGWFENEVGSCAASIPLICVCELAD